MLFFQRKKLEKQLILEMKQYAGVKDFPIEDANDFAKILNAYNKGKPSIALILMGLSDTIEKYPDLAYHWDEMMVNYKKLGLFPNWKITID